VVATGGLAGRVANESAVIDRVEPFLTLEGLRIIFEKNRPAPRGAGGRGEPKPNEVERPDERRARKDPYSSEKEK
jgi:hypothetical protein